MMHFFERLETAIIESSSYPIHKAVINKKFKVLQKLINSYQEELNKLYDGLTTLAYAYVNDQYDYMVLLLCGGTNPSIRFDYLSESTLLHTTVNEKNYSIVRLLVMFGADPHLTNIHGVSALQKAPENSMLRRTIEDTRTNYFTLRQSLSAAKEALQQNQHIQAAGYLHTVATCWESASGNETSSFFKHFYYATALAITKIAYHYHQSEELTVMIERLQRLVQQQPLTKKERQKMPVLIEQYLATFIHINAILSSVEQYREICSVS